MSENLVALLSQFLPRDERSENHSVSDVALHSQFGAALPHGVEDACSELEELLAPETVVAETSPSNYRIRVSAAAETLGAECERANNALTTVGDFINESTALAGVGERIMQLANRYKDLYSNLEKEHMREILDGILARHDWLRRTSRFRWLRVLGAAVAVTLGAATAVCVVSGRLFVPPLEWLFDSRLLLATAMAAVVSLLISRYRVKMLDAPQILVGVRSVLSTAVGDAQHGKNLDSWKRSAVKRLNGRGALVLFVGTLIAFTFGFVVQREVLSDRVITYTVPAGPFNTCMSITGNVFETNTGFHVFSKDNHFFVPKDAVVAIGESKVECDDQWLARSIGQFGSIVVGSGEMIDVQRALARLEILGAVFICGHTRRGAKEGVSIDLEFATGRIDPLTCSLQGSGRTPAN